MCLPRKYDQAGCCGGGDGDQSGASTDTGIRSSSGGSGSGGANLRSTALLSTAGMGAAMLLACVAGPALIAAAGGALAIGTLGLAGGALAIALCIAAPLAMRALQNKRGTSA